MSSKDPNGRLYGDFVAHVVKTNSADDQGIIYIRLIDQNLVKRWAKVSRTTPGVRFDVVFFDSLQAALDDARTISRCGPYHCETDIKHTPFTDKSIQMIVEFLEDAGQLKVA
ncbi:Uncharacterised protein [Ectopseudomonas mendocina]|uniref:Uncharacterized protein n=1 Tax=Ectopseudomonas mendocina TaxID=300 RepID=A0A379PPX0_ECTME|nr:hypothetical protein [Pseudomonas mendocina]SUE95884.1 Uncharacterised protein [Pseudomonas mendocina]